MATDEKLPEDIDTRQAPPWRPEIGQVVGLRGRPATVVDIAEYPGGMCQLVLHLSNRPGQPPVSVPLSDIDRPGADSPPPAAG